MQGKMSAVFVEVNGESTFFFFSTREYRCEQLGAFPRLLAVPPKVIRIAITKSAVERSHGSFWDTEEFRVLQQLLLAAHPCIERQSSDNQD